MVYRIEPKLPPQHMKTYQIARPVTEQFWRSATCEEVQCPQFLGGWMTVIEKMIDPDGQLEYTVRHSGRPFKECREPGKITFVFEPGTPCFKASIHKVPIEREPLYVVKDGDWRGNPRRTRPKQHTQPEHWVEDFANHQQHIADKIQEG